MCVCVSAGDVCVHSVTLSHYGPMVVPLYYSAGVCSVTSNSITVRKDLSSVEDAQTALELEQSVSWEARGICDPKGTQNGIGICGTCLGETSGREVVSSPQIAGDV